VRVLKADRDARPAAHMGSQLVRGLQEQASADPLRAPSRHFEGPRRPDSLIA